MKKLKRHRLTLTSKNISTAVLLIYTRFKLEVSSTTNSLALNTKMVNQRNCRSENRWPWCHCPRWSNLLQPWMAEHPGLCSCFVDSKQVIQMRSPDMGTWGAGQQANNRFIQVELCEEDSRDAFIKSVYDAIYIAKLLHRYDLQPDNACDDGQGTIWSHHAVSNFLGGTDHVDWWLFWKMGLQHGSILFFDQVLLWLAKEEYSISI